MLNKEFLKFYGKVNPSIKIDNKYFWQEKLIDIGTLNLDSKLENILFSNDRYVLISLDNRVAIFDKNKNKTKFIKTSLPMILGCIYKNKLVLLSMTNKLFIYDINTYDIIFSKQEEDINSISQNIAFISKI